MRFLKRLRLQGYKTFASQTEFVFDEGVTAIVGPNGSGKSNVADSLRWVLGEQSFGALRGKRTEDMIFSGSEQRARLGMAYVSLTLDNNSSWLPTEFSEVEIARRAYRSGENEYYLNGHRVRLREVSELLASSGLSERTYTVIGQGLVDQALSQRPEERRRLFEEAAGITAHQSKREQAAQRLVEAQTNLTRARDIINELTPRLRYLKGQARRVQEYQQIKRDLDANLKVWYSHRWHQARLALEASEERLAEQTRVTEEQLGRMEVLLRQAADRREERARLREGLGEWHRVSSQLHRQAEAVQRELAVRTEQVRLWNEQREGLEQELIHLRAAMEDGAKRLEAAHGELAAGDVTHKARLERVAEAQLELNALEAERGTRSQHLAEAQDLLLSLRTQLAEKRSLLLQLKARRSELAKADSEQAQGAEAAASQLADLERHLATSDEQIRGIQAELALLAQERQEHEAALAKGQQAERAAREQLETAQRGLGRLQDQQDLLTRLRDEGAGLAAGPRAVIAARGQLGGIVGLLGELIEVPPALERPIEAAMGGRLQDIVVQRWEDAESAVAFLKENRGGRATFLPLDTLRPPSAAAVPRAEGVLGLASQLVSFDEAIRPAVELALNHVLVVQNLPIARALLGDAAGLGLHALVTLEGEIVRPSGSVTGGSEDSRQDNGLLTRARTLRELPGKLRDAAEQVRAWEAQVAEAAAGQDSARTAMMHLRARTEESTESLETVRTERDRLQLLSERARQTRAWHEERRREIARELIELDTRDSASRAAVAELDTRIAGAEATEVMLQRTLATLSTGDLVAELARLRAEAAVSAGQRQSAKARVDELTALQQDRAREIDVKEEKILALDGRRIEASREISKGESAGQLLTAQIDALAAEIEPAEARIATLEQEQRAAEVREQLLREEVRRSQMRQSQAALTQQRARDEVRHLRDEIEKELGLVVLDAREETSSGLAIAQPGPLAAHGPGEQQEFEEMDDTQPPLPLDEMVTRLPVVTVLPDGLDNDVRSLRAQLARLGPVNLEALSEYQEVDARCSFLSSQVTDLEHATTTLEQVIAELDRVMEREFVATFRAVAAQFHDEFKELFSGGSAKLVLSDPDSLSTTGVEIVARPPGKREQGLALLSGGERALTAAALIFSILKCRPTPFCVLDEVDAMLDEANVGRFRDKLKELSKETQFILITHNRGTIEIADTIYGVSMGADNTSQVLSLKLKGREIVPLNSAELD